MLITFVIGIGAICGAWWYLQFWPFDGSTALPKRDAPPPIPKS